MTSPPRIALSEVERETLRGVAFMRGIPAKVLAHQIGVSPSLFTKWLGGQRRPTQQQMAAWWRAVTDTS
jgi:hypothetical protein